MIATRTTSKKTKLVTGKRLRQWDAVRCKYCGKTISMLNSRYVSSGDYFVCKGGCAFHA